MKKGHEICPFVMKMLHFGAKLLTFVDFILILPLFTFIPFLLVRTCTSTMTAAGRTTSAPGTARTASAILCLTSPAQLPTYNEKYNSA